MLFLTLILIILIYLLLCRAGITQCDIALLFLFRPIITRLQQQQYQQEQQPPGQPSLATITRGTIRKTRNRQNSLVLSFFDDSNRFNNLNATH
jgi:hypothetical protein